MANLKFQRESNYKNSAKIHRETNRKKITLTFTG